MNNPAYGTWLWSPSWNETDDRTPRIVCFRKEFSLGEIPDSFRESRSESSSGWRCRIDRDTVFAPEEEDFAPLWIHEAAGCGGINSSTDNTLSPAEASAAGGWEPAVVIPPEQIPPVLRQAIRRTCLDENGILTDGPGVKEYSQHCQVFGILTGTLTPEEGKRNLLKSIEDPAFTQCTVAMCYYLFRALEQTGLYEYTDRYWNIWRKMLASHCTTCVESEGYSRSECHAWGALALYELPSVILGVRPAAPGYEKIRISPVPGYLTAASGTVCTPKGCITVSWERQNGELHCTTEAAPEILHRILR